jgi:cobalt-zinc-cadmium efflux system membrane fusion protein
MNAIQKRNRTGGLLAQSTNPTLPANATSRRLHRLPVLLLALTLAGCKHADSNKADEAPPTPTVTEVGGSSSVHVDKPEQFPLVQAISREVTSQLNVTGSVNPDVSRELPVLSLANGRVTALHVGLGDFVKKGQLVMDVQSPDVTNAFDAYLKAVNDEHLTDVTLKRDKLLYEKGAIAQSQLEGAQNGEDDARADLVAAAQQLHILGVDKDHPSETVHIYAPTSGVVVQQNVTNAAAAGITYAGSTGSLLIADLSHVWVIVDVYENDLAQVHLGQHADIHVNAIPGKTFSGTISDIGAVLDPSLRTAKVRIQVQNPAGQLRLGMFATATLEASKAQSMAALPATAILQLHDRSFVFVPTGQNGQFRRVTITTGRTLDGGLIEVLTGLAPGQQVVSNALDLQNTADQ